MKKIQFYSQQIIQRNNIMNTIDSESEFYNYYRIFVIDLIENTIQNNSFFDSIISFQ